MVKDIIDGSLLTKKVVIEQLPYIIFLIVIAFVYIANQYHAENLAMESAKVQREIKELRAEAISIASEYMYLTKRTEIEKLVKARGLDLETCDKPPVVLHVVKSEE